MKALIKVGYGCNDHCTFCHTLDVRHIDGEAAEVHAKIERARALGHSMVVLSGGEPTIRPELTAWARHVARLGMGFGLVTNGRVLSYPALVDELVKQRLEYVYLSLHGGTAKIHNLMVRSQAFEQTYKAIEVLAGRGLDFTVNCVVTKHNMRHLRPVVDALVPYPDVGLKFSMVEPKGGGKHLFDHLIPSVEEVAELVADAITYGREVSDCRITHGAIPLCLMPGFEAEFDDLRTHQFATMTEIGEPDFFPVDDRNKVQPSACDGCELRGPCPGLYAAYHERFGAVELKPRRKAARPNSFNYVHEGMLRPGTQGGCSLLQQGLTPWERGRHLFVRNGERIARFRASTRDFADVEIDRIKHDLGQVYLDISKKTAPDDFAADLVRLRRAEECSSCPEYNHCTGMYDLDRTNVFARDDARVRALLAGMRGRVLDVGCGEAPYADVLAPLAQAGEIEYVGIDPDAGAITSLREKWPWAQLEVARGEDLGELALGMFDHAVVLRSWNHVPEPDKMLRAIAASLRPGGSLIVVDNVAFGLARTRTQTQRAEGGPAEFEHFRNDSAEHAHRVASTNQLPFELIERQDVGPETSNQWLLRFQRAAAGSNAIA